MRRVCGLRNTTVVGLTCILGPPDRSAGWSWWGSAGEDQVPILPTRTSEKGGETWGIRARWGSWRLRFWCCLHIYLQFFKDRHKRDWAEHDLPVLVEHNFQCYCLYFYQYQFTLIKQNIDVIFFLIVTRKSAVGESIWSFQKTKVEIVQSVQKEELFFSGHTLPFILIHACIHSLLRKLSTVTHTSWKSIKLGYDE